MARCQADGDAERFDEDVRSRLPVVEAKTDAAVEGEADLWARFGGPSPARPDGNPSAWPAGD